jgi:hypothetical protein
MTPIWLMRMAGWVRNPPSPARVRLVLGVIALCLVIAGIEYLWGWPEALSPQRIRP